jgi:hypothetical protein
MKTPKQKLILTQETLRALTQEQPQAALKNMITTAPMCPTCSGILQGKGGMQ